jgi:hypothetical protein
MLVGGRGYGRDSQPGKINNLHAMNIFGDGGCLIRIGSEIANCSFSNGVYTGKEDEVIRYSIDKSKTTNVFSQNLIKTQ